MKDDTPVEYHTILALHHHHKQQKQQQQTNQDSVRFRVFGKPVVVVVVCRSFVRSVVCARSLHTHTTYYKPTSAAAALPPSPTVVTSVQQVWGGLLLLVCLAVVWWYSPLSCSRVCNWAPPGRLCCKL